MKELTIIINGVRYDAVDIPVPSDASKMVLCFVCHLQPQCKTLPMSVIDICHKAIGNKVFNKEKL
jgi:hypothetical protein